jgi:anti-sigma factor RsiW
VLIGAVFGAGLDWRLRERGSAADVAGPRIAEDAVAGHVRAILTGRLIDVASSDQHTVKPWLSARLTYSPPVPDLSAHGFELAGARRDVIDGQLVAALVYRRRQHIISAYVQPAPDHPVRPEPATRTFRGFNVIEATQGSLRYWIVSDLNVRELGDFADFLRAGG